MGKANQGWDVIGDIHGHADALRRLLAKLEYREIGGVFRHPDRRAVFLGDYIDRGPAQKEVLEIVRRMCDGGAALALLGNHEFNAVGWARGYKPVKPSYERQRAEFLRQIADASSEYWSAIEWFESLPVWLDLDGLSLVHACWHGPSMQALAPHLSENALTKTGWREAHLRGSPTYDAAEVLLKGPEREVEAAFHFLDKDGNLRRHKRIDWWLDVESGPYRSKTPILFGHYWLTGAPRLLGPRASCLDFSVAAGGSLTCYRWSGEETLRVENLVAVACSSEGLADGKDVGPNKASAARGDTGCHPAVALALAAGMRETGRLAGDADIIEHANELEARAYAALQAGRDTTKPTRH